MISNWNDLKNKFQTKASTIEFLMEIGMCLIAFVFGYLILLILYGYNIR